MRMKRLRARYRRAVLRRSKEGSSGGAAGQDPAAATGTEAAVLGSEGGDAGGALDAILEQQGLRPEVRDIAGLLWSALTPRQAEALELLGSGLTYSKIAARMVISRHTVRNHLRSAMRTLGVRGKKEALAWLAAHPRCKPG